MVTTYFSDHYGPAVGATGHTARSTNPSLVNAGIRHGRVRRSACFITIANATTLGSGDVIRFLDMKSGSRPVEIYASMDADWGATATFDIGLYKKGNADDGAVIDADLWASAVDWSGAIARTEYFKESTTFTDMDRGQPLWWMADVGAGTYSTDPFETWTFAATATQALTVTAAAVTMMFEVWYMAND